MSAMTATTSEPAQLDASAGMLLTLLGRASTRLFTEALRPIGLKPRHLAALTRLRETPLTQQALGDLTRTDPTKLVGLLNDLERWGLIVRRRDPDDRRRHIVEISGCGRERLAEVDRLVAATDQRILGALDGDQQRLFLDLLGRIAAASRVAGTCTEMAVAADDDDADDCDGAA
jgi:DNA-binding MarR family transcriptional regulator